MPEIVRPIYVTADATQDDLHYGLGSLFLAGPTPRCKRVKSWRPEFIKTLKKQKVRCSVFIPELKKGGWLGNQERQNGWEYRHLHNASAVVFWVPRDLDRLPGFTTNVEFGYWVKSDRCFYGRPDGAAKTEYLDWMYEKEGHGMPASSMEELAETVTKWLLG
jgi:hypothetical protein